MNEPTLQDVIAEIRENRALILQVKASASLNTTKEKIEKIMKVLEEKGEINVLEVANIFGISNKYALTLMKKTKEQFSEEVLFYPGCSNNPSRLVMFDEENKLDRMALLVIEELNSRGRSSTKRISSLVKYYKLNKEDIQPLISRIVKLSNGKIICPLSSASIFERRLLKK